MGKITEMITRGEIPVIAALLKDGEVSLEVVDAQKAADGYAAISHVWSEGLGNAQSNSLPLCQLRKIIGYCRQVEKTLPISTDGVMKKGIVDKTLVLKGASKIVAVPGDAPTAHERRPE